MSTSPASSRLFVYGSLKRGADNHGQLRRSPYLGDARTAPSYRLYVVAGFPALTLGGDRSIAGELYAVNDRLLSELDEFEGDGYSRGEVLLDDGSVAITYLLAGVPPRNAIPFTLDSWR